MDTFLARYERGEHEQVRNELMALGELDLAGPVAIDAYAVARETMRRVRYNLELLVPRLRDLGYVFGHGWAVARGIVTAQGAAEWD